MLAASLTSATELDRQPLQVLSSKLTWLLKMTDGQRTPQSTQTKIAACGQIHLLQFTWPALRISGSFQ